MCKIMMMKMKKGRKRISCRKTLDQLLQTAQKYISANRKNADHGWITE